MGAEDLLFETVADAKAVYSPLDLDAAAYAGPPVQVRVTNQGLTTLSGLKFFVRPATNLGDEARITDDPPETDFQKAVSWGDDMENDVAVTAGGIKVDLPAGDVFFTEAWQVDVDAGPGFSDETAALASAAAADTDPLDPAGGVGDYFAMGYAMRFSSLTLDVGVAGTVGAMTWKYWDGAAWQNLAGVTDNTSSMTVADERTVSWTVPTDWAPQALNGGASLYYVAAVSDGNYVILPVINQGWLTRLTNYITWDQGCKKSNGLDFINLAPLASAVFEVELEAPVPAVAAERVYFDVVIED